MDTISREPDAVRFYKAFGEDLCRRGFIVYSPQNPYRGGDQFRSIQRKANPLGLSLFSFIIEQHRQTIDWLATLPNVDGDRIAFYGLSYGGKTAMRVPPLLDRYCLSICSGDFTDWAKTITLTPITDLEEDLRIQVYDRRMFAEDDQLGQTLKIPLRDHPQIWIAQYFI